MNTHPKTCMVTGASTGIGRAVCIELAKQGYTVYGVARSKAGLLETQHKIQESGGSFEFFQADLSNQSGINNLIDQIKKQISQVHALINIAGIWHGENEVYAGKDFEQFSQQVVVDTISVGLTAPTLLAHACIPLMSKGSTIVNLSGTFENGAKGWLPYYVSKRAIEDLTIALAQELQSKEINVFGVSPSDTATAAYAKYFPQYMEEAVQPEIIANFIAELCLNKNSQDSGKIFVIKKGLPIVDKFHA